jgi:hypothetical protein
LLPATKFLELRAALNPLLDDRNILIKKLADDYSIYLEGAKRLLNGTFKESDYPAVTEVVSRFHHKLDVFPIADPRDAKLNVLSEIADSINEAVAETFKEKAESVVPYIREVLLDPLVKFSETLQNPEATFKDSLVENLREACDRAETLNILEDNEIVDAVYEIRQRLTCNPDRLRDDKVYRSDAVSNAAPIIESLGGTIPAPKVVAPRKPRTKKSKSDDEEFSETAPSSSPSSSASIDESPFVTGIPTMGKSNIVAEVAADTGVECVDVTLQSESPITDEQIDPAANNADATFNPDALLAKLGW